MTQHTPPTDQQLDDIEARVTAALHCPNAEANGRLDGQHTLSGSFSHIRCELCTYTRPRGERVEETAALLAEVRRLRAELATGRVNGIRYAAELVTQAFHGEPFLCYPPDFADLLRDHADRLTAATQAAPAVVVGGVSGTNQ